MPPRDAYEYEHRRRQIIDAALQVFAAKGFEKATNKEIADAANIASPGLIYHYFKDKADLLRQVLEQRAEVFGLLAHADELLERPPREVFALIGSAAVHTLEAAGTIPLFKVMFGEALRRQSVAGIVNGIGPGPALGFLTRYLERQMELGTIRRVDARAAARTFLGPLLAYVVTREVFAQPDALALPPETMVATMIDIFLTGLEPPGGAARRAEIEA